MIIFFIVLLSRALCLSTLSSFIAGPEDSLFGYSAAFHAEAGATRVLVGAPRAETVQRRFGVRSPGAVFECDPLRRHCLRVPFDRNGNNYDNGRPIDDKSDQWFGASVSSAGVNGAIACAPRYLFHSINGRRKELVGTCFLGLSNLTQFSEFSPCRTEDWGYHQQGFCQVGLSTATFEHFFFVGAVGSNYWQGQVFAKPREGNLTALWNKWNDTNDNQYLGYSIQVGRFFNENFSVVIGAPRAMQLRGRVHIVSSRDSIVQYTFTGEQIGSYFGHSIAVGDINGDGLDDILIGAPLFSSRRVFEVGRVYLVLQERPGIFKSWRILDGPKEDHDRGGRFGFVVTSAGDLNGDGRVDFCVSAPLNDRVYVFLGRRRLNLDYAPVKVLKPLTDGAPSKPGGLFGLSVTASSKVLNGPNVAVGAPLHDKLYFFRV